MKIATRTVVAADGARLTYYDTGGSGPAVVLANGLGGPLRAWRHQIAHLARHFRVMSWDYRGLYGSTLPPGGARSLDVHTHARDLAAVLDEASVDRAALVGWSMGVQVSLELYDKDPKRVSHLVLLNGTADRPFSNLPFFGARLVVPRLVDRLAAYGRFAEPAMRRATRTDLLGACLKRFGFLSATLDSGEFRRLAEDFSGVDLEIYFRTLALLGRHDVSHVLPSVRVPTLLVAGARDPLTPRTAIERAARRVPNAELWIVPGATHYAAAEYPELVSRRIEAFLLKSRDRATT
jgi:3-oxoadipate enol-lactonase